MQRVLFFALLTGFWSRPFLLAQTPREPTPTSATGASSCIVDVPSGHTDSAGSTYVAMDSWLYPAMDRLHALGYGDAAFLGMRPWTRVNILQLLRGTGVAHPEDAVAHSGWNAQGEYGRFSLYFRGE